MKRGRRLARAIAIAVAAGGLSCTDLDALGGSEPDLPWSPAAPGVAAAPATARPFAVALSGGALELDADEPRAVADCADDAGACADQDRDGLVDRWEDAVLDGLRPLVRIDDGEPLRVDADGRVASIGRVAPAPVGGREGGLDRVRVTIVLAYSNDYGRCTFGGHRGDSERVALDLAPLAGRRGAVRVVGAYTAAHEWSDNDTSRLFTGDLTGQLEYAEDLLTGQPRWLVYASRSKHATYATAAACEAQDSWIFCGDEDCAAGRSVSPPNELLIPVVNAGEPGAPRAEELMDEPVWEDVRFCGGLGDGDDSCASPLRDKLLDDPFAG